MLFWEGSQCDATAFVIKQNEDYEALRGIEGAAWIHLKIPVMMRVDH